MKERVLTNAELGEYAYNSTYDTMEYILSVLSFAYILPKVF